MFISFFPSKNSTTRCAVFCRKCSACRHGSPSPARPFLLIFHAKWFLPKNFSTRKMFSPQSHVSYTFVLCSVADLDGFRVPKCLSTTEGGVRRTQDKAGGPSAGFVTGSIQRRVRRLCPRLGGGSAGLNPDTLMDGWTKNPISWFPLGEPGSKNGFTW